MEVFIYKSFHVTRNTPTSEILPPPLIWYHTLKIKWNIQNFDINVVTFLPYTYELPYESDLIAKFQVQSQVQNKVLV